MHKKNFSKALNISIKTKNLVAFLLLAASVLSITPIFGSLIPIGGNYIHSAFLGLIFLLYLTKYRGCIHLNSTSAIFTSLILIFAIFNSIYWQAPTFVFIVYFLSAYLLSIQVNQVYLHAYTNFLTNFLLLILIGALFGFMYASAGGEPLLSFKNPDGRENKLFFTTFTNTVFHNLIRPSGIYDEPGALSFLVCLTVAFREALKMPRTKSNWLLFIGLVTTSLAHIVFCVLYLIHISLVKSPKHSETDKTHTLFITLFFIACFFIFFSSESILIIEHFFKRLTINDGEFVAGSDRVYLMKNTISYIDIHSFLFGLDGDCIMQNDLCGAKDYLPFGENPLSMLTYYGATLSLPYYAVIFFLLAYSIRRKNLIVFAVFLLLLQRPYVMSFSYSVIIMLFVRTLVLSDTPKKICSGT